MRFLGGLQNKVAGTFARISKSLRATGKFMAPLAVRLWSGLSDWRAISAILATLALLIAWKTFFANFSPSFQLACTVAVKGRQPFPGTIYFADLRNFIRSDTAIFVGWNDLNQYEVGRTYAYCTVENLGRASYDITVPVEVALSETPNAPSSPPVKRTIHIDELATSSKFDFAIADLSPIQFMHVHFRTEASAIVQGIDVPRQYPIISAPSNRDVEDYPFDVVDLKITPAKAVQNVRQLLANPQERKHLIVVPPQR
jgi:hypothetical protein